MIKISIILKNRDAIWNKLIIFVYMLTLLFTLTFAVAAEQPDRLGDPVVALGVIVTARQRTSRRCKNSAYKRNLFLAVSVKLQIISLKIIYTGLPYARMRFKY